MYKFIFLHISQYVIKPEGLTFVISMYVHTYNLKSNFCNFKNTPLTSFY